MIRITLSKLAAAALCASTLVVPTYAAGPYTWDGGGTTDNLLENLNWSDDVGPQDFQVRAGGNTSATNVDTSIIFAGNTRLTPYVAAAGWLSDDAVPPATNPDINSNNFYNNITFDAGAGSFSIELGPGNPSGSLRLGPTAATTTIRTIANNSSNPQTFNLPVLGSWVNVVATSGDIIFNNTYQLAVGSLDRRIAVSGDFGVQFNAGLTGAGADAVSPRFGGFLELLGPGKSYIRASSASTSGDSVGGLWNGRVEISNGILEVSNDTALGAGFAQSATSGRTTIGTAVGNTGRLELAGDAADDSISSSERIFVTGRSASFDTAVAHIRNLHGSNTLSGPIESQNVTGAQSVVIQADDDGAGTADFLTLAGNLTQSRAAAVDLVLRGNGAGAVTGNIVNGATPATMTWNLRKLDSGTWTINGAGNNFTGATQVAEGTLKLGAAGSIATSSTIQIDTNGTLDVSAQAGFTIGSAGAQILKGDGVVNGDVAIAAGGTLVVDYNGSVIDSLAFSGALNIANATLDFNNLGSLLTTEPHVFATYGTLVGTSFASVVDLPSGFAIDYHYLGNQIALVSSIAGDFDADGDVDGADFVAWQTHYPTAGGATLATGDANGDGNVDGADFAVWQNNFPASPAATIAVPEPPATLLIAISAFALCAGLGRRRRT